MQSLSAQSAPGASVGSSANADWGALLNLTSSAKGASSVPTTMSAFVAQQVSQYQSVQAAAFAFGANHGTDSRAGAARKIGVMAAIQTYAVGGAAYGSAASALATAYRRDKSVPVADRFDVALAIDSNGVPLSAGQRLIDNGPGYKALADALHQEFGEVDPVYHLYSQVMQTADVPTSVAVAKELLTLSAPPSWVTADANKVVNRFQMIGSPLKVTMILLGGKPLDLSVPVAVPTLIYFWSNQVDNSQLAALGQYSRFLPKNARIIYVCLQGDSRKIAASQSQLPLPGQIVFEASGLNSPEETGLGVMQMPYVYTLDSLGRLSGYGRIEDIPALMTVAER